jgi:hypothetical protein
MDYRLKPPSLSLFAAILGENSTILRDWLPDQKVKKESILEVRSMCDRHCNIILARLTRSKSWTQRIVRKQENRLYQRNLCVRHKLAEGLLLYLRFLSLFCASSENSQDTLDISPLLVENNFFGTGQTQQLPVGKRKTKQFPGKQQQVTAK